MLLTLLLACGAPPGTADADLWSADGTGAPPVELALTVPELVPGEVSTITVTGAPVGAELYLVTGAPGDGPCPPVLDGGCVDVTRPAVLGTAIADDLGDAAFELAIPEALALGTTPTFQVVSRDPALSEAITSRVVAPDAKTDFVLDDLNSTSPTFEAPVSPRDYLAKVSGWYFGHAT